MVCQYKVKEAKPSKALYFKFPGSDKRYFSYNKCKRDAFETFCIEYMKYRESGYSADRHPILECIDYADHTYKELVKPPEGVIEPPFWCAACNWRGTLTITYFAKHNM